MFRALYGCLVLVLCCDNVIAAEKEGSEYYEQCISALSFNPEIDRDQTTIFNAGFCFGVIDGLRGANAFIKNANPKIAFCEPASFKTIDLVKTVVQQVKLDSKLKELRGSLMAQVALHRAFPCKL